MCNIKFESCDRRKVLIQVFEFRSYHITFTYTWDTRCLLDGRAILTIQSTISKRNYTTSINVIGRHVLLVNTRIYRRGKREKKIERITMHKSHKIKFKVFT